MTPAELGGRITITTTKSWAQFGDHPEVVVTQTGGRQGCQLGSIIFNATYAIAILEVHKRLSEQNLVFAALFVKALFGHM